MAELIAVADETRGVQWQSASCDTPAGAHDADHQRNARLIFRVLAGFNRADKTISRICSAASGKLGPRRRPDFPLAITHSEPTLLQPAINAPESLTR